jgi:hypothetical protein
MKKLFVFALVVLMETAVVAAAFAPASAAPETVPLPAGGGALDQLVDLVDAAEGGPALAPGRPTTVVAADQGAFDGPLPAFEPFVPQRSYVVGGSTLEELLPPVPYTLPPMRAPQPQSVDITSNSSIILFVRQTSPAIPTQMPTVAEVAAGAKPIAFHNASQTGFNFTGKLYETVVGNQSINSTDQDLGIANQTLDVTFDGGTLAIIPTPLITGNSTSAIPPPFIYPNGTFEFYVPQFLVSQCGAHVLTINYNNLTAGNNATFFGSVAVDFSLYVTCPTTLTVAVDTNPAVVGEDITFSGELKTQDVIPVGVPGREIMIMMDGNLLGNTGPGVCLDGVSVNGTLFDESFEQESGSGTGWNSTGSGVGTWAIGPQTMGPVGPPNLFGSQMACTGLDSFYGRGVNTHLVTPRIDLTSAGPAPFLQFYYWFNISADDYFEILVSIDGGLTFSAYQETISNPSAVGQDVSGGGANPTWDARQISLASFAGSPQVVVAFHFRSAPYTTHTDAAGAYQFVYTVPFETEAKSHTVYALFGRGMPRDGIDDVTITPSLDPETATDLVFELAQSLATIRLDIKRIAHFEFSAVTTDKVGFRAQALAVFGRLADNMGEPLIEELFLGKYIVRLCWDRDYNDPNDACVPLGQSEVNYDSGGAFSRSYVVDVHQPLGLHNMTAVFEGSTYYTNTTGVDVYRLMAHTTVEWPPEALRYTFRFQDARVNGTLRIVRNESRFDLLRGDPVVNELVHIRWEGDEIPEGQVGVLANSTGGFEATKRIPFDEALGRKAVTLRYDGSDVYVGVAADTNWSVVSTTNIQLEESSVYKGSFLWFNGTLLDDRGVGIAGQTLQLFFDHELVQPVSTGSDGSYSYRHFVDRDFTVGLKEARVRFFGNPIYLANETIHNVSVKAHTQLERTDHTLLVERGSRLNVSGRLFEIYEGGGVGDTSPVALESVSIRIEDRRLTLANTNTEGEFDLRTQVPGDLDIGEAELVFEFNGSDFYDAADNSTLIVVQGRSVVNFDRASLERNGAFFDVRNDTLHQQETLTGIIRVTDELGNPVAAGDLRFFFSYQTGEQAEPIFISAGPVDELGRFSFNVTFPESDFVRGNRTLLATYNGSFCPTSLSARTLCLKSSTGNVTINYEYELPPTRPVDDTILYGVLAAVGIIVGAVVYFFWYAAKRRQLQRMQRIIRRAADRLVSGNPYAQVIFDAYRALAKHLQANGYMRADSETFREFENALRQALPIDAKSMDEFLSILEEARYSDHEIGEAQKDRAIAALTGVTNSIDQILAAGGAGGAAAPAPMPVEAPPPPPMVADVPAGGPPPPAPAGADTGGAAPEEGPKEP